MRYTSPIFPALDALNDGRIIRRAVSLFLLIVGTCVLVGGGFGVLMMLGVTFSVGASADIMVGGVLYSALFGLLSFAIFDVFRYRARTIQGLRPSTHTVLPIFSIICRLSGEVYAVILIAMGIGGVLLNLFGASVLSRQTPFGFGTTGLVPGASLLPSAGLVGGLMFVMLMGVLAFLVLLASYAAAEGIVVLADIARNTKTLVDIQRSPGTGDTSSPAVAPLVPTDTPARPESVHVHVAPTGIATRARCPQCAAEILEPENAFCVNCGARLR